jgi:hypothetical protein
MIGPGLLGCRPCTRISSGMPWQCPAEWWALRLILGVYLPLSFAAMPPVLLVGSSWAMDPSDR